MRMVSIELLVNALREKGIDQVYAILERLFYEEPLVVIDSNGKALFTPYEVEELWDYLEGLLNKEVEPWR